MLTDLTYDYAVLRVVPRVDREEFANVGVVLFCLQRRYLACSVHLDAGRLRILWPATDIDAVRRHVGAVERVCAGESDAGPVAKMPQRERFHWLTAPRSAILQTSPVRTGICSEETDLPALLHEIAAQMLSPAACATAAATGPPPSGS